MLERRALEPAAGRAGEIGEVREIEGKPDGKSVEQTPINVLAPVDRIDADRTGLGTAHRRDHVPKRVAAPQTGTDRSKVFNHRAAQPLDSAERRA
jgi:hypothetical protein